MPKLNLENIQAYVLAKNNLDLSNINLDAPTQEDTEFHQELAGQIESARKGLVFDYQQLRNLLEHAPQHKKTRTLMINWLKQIGYTNIYVPGESCPIPIEQAPSTNIYAFYTREVAALSRKVRQIEKRYS